MLALGSKCGVSNEGGGRGGSVGGLGNGANEGIGGMRQMRALKPRQPSEQATNCEATYNVTHITIHQKNPGLTIFSLRNAEKIR
jgi:hypothetical protein